MIPSYASNDPKGWCGDPSRGAALGRPSIHTADHDVSIKLVLQRVRLDSGGYDRNGTYFGHGAPLYWYAGETEDASVDAVLRAEDRETAKAAILKIYPNARFYR